MAASGKLCFDEGREQIPKAQGKSFSPLTDVLFSSQISLYYTDKTLLAYIHQ